MTEQEFLSKWGRILSAQLMMEMKSDLDLVLTNKFRSNDFNIIETVLNIISYYFGFEKEKVYSKKYHKREIVDARHICFYVLKYTCKISANKIAKYFEMDHTSILNGLENVEMFSKDDSYMKDLKKIIAIVKEKREIV